MYVQLKSYVSRPIQQSFSIVHSCVNFLHFIKSAFELHDQLDIQMHSNEVSRGDAEQMITLLLWFVQVKCR